MYWYKQDTPIDYRELYYRKNSAAIRLEKTLLVLIIFLFMSGSFLAILSRVHYLDLTNQCYIRIKHDVMSGNKYTIKDALKKLRNENIYAYVNICKSIDTIYEKPCISSIDKDNNKIRADTQGCFVKGAKAIMITPYQRYSVEAVDSRADMIVYLSKLSASYWSIM